MVQYVSKKASEEECSQVCEDHQDKTELRQKYFNEKSSYSLETRLEMQEVIEEINREKENVGDVPKKEKKERKMFMSDGRPFNINEPRLEFSLSDGSPSETVLTLQVFLTQFLQFKIKSIRSCGNTSRRSLSSWTYNQTM